MDTMEWLQETENPSVRFRALSELSRLGDTAEALEAKRFIPSSAPVISLLGKMHPDGYWLQKNQQSGRVLGEGTEYGSFGTTHFCLAYCAELGLVKHTRLSRKPRSDTWAFKRRTATGRAICPACMPTISGPL